MDSEEVKSIFDIDEDELDREWLLQSRYYMEYALELADARAEMDSRKADLELRIANLELAIRDEPHVYNLKKVTESLVKAAVIVQPAYEAALRRYNKARHTVAKLSAVVDALDHRKKTLENLVILRSMNYHSEPKDRTGGEYVREDRKSKVRKSTPRKK